MLKLIGSKTSPYVRKVRLLLNDFNWDYKFEEVQALSDEGEVILKSYGPVLRIPILIDGDKTIFDSSLISEYLLEKKNILLSIEDKLKLKMIDELCDTGVDLVKQKAWNIDVEYSDKRSRKCLTRLNLILDELEKEFENLNEMQMDWLFCSLDWLKFRSILKFNDGHKKLHKFYQDHLPLEKFIKTSPDQ